MPPVVNSNSSNGNACLDEFLGSTVFDSEHAIDKRCPLRLIARVLQPVLLRNLAISFAIVLLDQSSYVAFEINGLVVALNDALADARGTENIGVKYVIHVRALE